MLGTRQNSKGSSIGPVSVRDSLALVRTLWMRVGGPLLILILAGLIEFLRDTPLRITNPPALFVLVIVFAGFSSGLLPTIISAMLSWAYTAYFFSGPGLFDFTEDNFRRVAVWSVVMPLIAWMVGALNRRTSAAMAQAKLGELERTRWEERVRAQEELRRSEAYLAEAQTLAHAGSWAWNVGTREFVHCSQEFYRLHGLDPSAGIPPWEAVQRQIHPEDREHCNEQLDRAIRERTECVMEFRCMLPDGTTRIIQSISHPVLGPDGAPIEFVGTEIDITDRKRGEELLRESEARFRTFVDHAADAFFLLDYDADGKILDVNRQACESLGYSREELIGKTALEIDTWLTPDDLNRIGERVKSGDVFAFETRYCRKDKTDFPVEVHIRPFLHGGRRLGVSLARDITERKQAEKALNDSHDLLRAVVEGTPDPIFAKDLQGRCRLINSAGARFLGRTVEEVLGKDDTELLPADAAQGVRERDLRILETGEMETFEETVTSASGTRTYLSTKSPYRDRHGNVIGLVGIARDITELKRLEDQLRQAQKMEALGRLAGGVAHDFNNLLTVISGYSELTFNNLRPEDPCRGSIAEVQKAAERAVNLTRQLLAFSRKQVLQPQVLSLNPLISDLCKMLQRLIGEEVELTYDLDPEVGLVKVDPTQFEQALINLAVNARDAIGGAGSLTVKTHNVRMDASHSGRFADVRSGEYVVIEVADTGRGMNESTKARVFEPFFTTKEAGKGTGLGLSMVYGFVKQSGGHVEVESEQGRGTTFRLYLPLTDDTEPSPARLQEQSNIPKGDETILLVEDEEAVRTLTRLVLQSYGYTVLEARDGQDGLWIVQQYSGTIHLVITDLVMPRMGGRQLVERLTRMRPNPRVLFMSGHTEDEGLQKGDVEAVAGFVHKPFSPLALARKVRQVLDMEVPVR